MPQIRLQIAINRADPCQDMSEIVQENRVTTFCDVQRNFRVRFSRLHCLIRGPFFRSSETFHFPFFDPKFLRFWKPEFPLRMLFGSHRQRQPNTARNFEASNFPRQIPALWKFGT